MVLFTLQANSSYAQRTKITLDLNNVSVERLIDEIESQTDFHFVYQIKEVDLNRIVSIQAKKELVPNVLERIFGKTRTTHNMVDKQIFLKERVPQSDTLSPKVQSGPIKLQMLVSGRVTDNDGSPLSGANLVEKGTTNGVTADFDGNFAIGLEDSNAVLMVSYIGYSTKEVPVNGQASVNIVLEESTAGLDEVVVIGYGTSKKSEITGSVGVVTAEDISKQPSVNPLQNLRGKIAGVTVFTNSGAPGGNNRVLIRGQGTINASTAPLYVVDGVQTDNIDYLNPSDILSMEVLKDASSAAIYGARGANGVVMITTQRGLDSKGLLVEYKTSVSMSTLAKKTNTRYNPMNASEFMEMQRIAFDNAPYFRDYNPGDEPTLELGSDLLFDSNGNPLYDTDWEKEITRTAISHDHHLSIRSGGDHSSTGLFLNYTDQNGIILNTFLKRADVKFTYDTQLSEWLSLGTVFRLSHVKERTNDIESSRAGAVIRSVYEYPSIFPIRWPDGTYSNSTHTQGTSLNLYSYPNPVSVLNEVEDFTDRTNIDGNIFADIKITPELTLRSQFGIVNRNFKNRYYAPKTIVDYGFPDGSASITNRTSTFWQNENFLTYDKTLDSSHFKAILGASWQEFTLDENRISVRGFKNDFFKYNSLGAAEITNPPSSNFNDWSMNSYFFRGNYTYNGKYTATLTGRMDGSSRFGTNNKYAFFPSGGVSWFISEENFMSEIKAINMLRLRGSYGITGNTEIGSYSSLATVSSGTNLIGGSLRSTSTITRLANPNLKWEKSSQVNLGLNLRAFNNILSMEAEYYYKLTTDLLLDRPVPSHTGFTSITDNIGSVSNRGIDLLISTRNIETQSFVWNTTLSVNYNKNRVESLGENGEDIFAGPFWVDGSQTILRVGEPVSSFWGLERLGTYGTDEAAEAAAVGKLPGMVKRGTEKQIIGHGLPDYRGSFINKFDFGQFDAIMDMQFSLGADILQQFVTTAEDRTGQSSGFKTILYDSWTPENQDTPITIIRHSAFSGQDLAVDSHWVANGSYLRANLFSLGYNFKKDVLDKMSMKSLRLNISLENAFVIKSGDFKGYDPESNGQWDDSNFGQNIFFYAYPKARTLTVGLNVQF
tara:strand:+ start:1767 stop:5093 length:3327 start_codon:yes stop_codon:yes gene_type:complete